MKKPNILLCLSVCFLIGCIFTVSMVACNKDQKTEDNSVVQQTSIESEKTTKEEIPDVTTEKEKTTKEEPTKKETTTVKNTSQAITKKPESTKPQVTKVTEKTTRKQITTTKAPATTKPHTTEPSTKSPQTTKPVTTKPQTTKVPEKTTKVTETTKAPAKYSCGAAYHKCTTKEEHSFIKSLETKGCPTCGSHSCKSFYSVDEFGNNCYDMTRCPKYSTKNDPLINCEYCGKPCGAGDKGTCVRFTVDTKCPGCGVNIKAKTCHSH